MELTTMALVVPLLLLVAFALHRKGDVKATLRIPLLGDVSLEAKDKRRGRSR
jgi:hypothetical protein